MKYILELPYDFSEELVEDIVRKAFNKRVKMEVSITKVYGKIAVPEEVLAKI